MGLFTNKQPQVMTAAQGMAQAGSFLGKALDPLVEQAGYQSQENQVIEIMKGVDVEDIDSFNSAYKEILGIDPEAAAEFKAQVFPMIKTTQELRKGQNKPLIAQRWKLEGRPNFIQTFASTRLAGIEGYDNLIAKMESNPKEAEYDINHFLNSMEKGADKTTLKAEYKKQLKEAKTAYSDFWGNKKDLNSGDKKAVAEEVTQDNTLNETQPTGTQAGTGYFTPNPENSQLMQGVNKIGSKVELWNELRMVRDSIQNLTPEFLMTDKELDLEHKTDIINDWINEGVATDHFVTAGPKAFAQFRANPVQYYETVIKKASK